MSGAHWYDFDRARAVLEYLRTARQFPQFTFIVIEGRLGWEGRLTEAPGGVEAPPLQVRLLYPAAYPVCPPEIVPLCPDLPDEHWGHEWHRWREGAICIVQPKSWSQSYTAADALAKTADWYYNYLAKTHNLIAAMPDVGRAQIPWGAGDRG